jgi:hypothetical protein
MTPAEAGGVGSIATPKTPKINSTIIFRISRSLELLPRTLRTPRSGIVWMRAVQYLKRLPPIIILKDNFWLADARNHLNLHNFRAFFLDHFFHLVLISLG